MCINNKNIDMFLLFIHILLNISQKAKKKKKQKKAKKKKEEKAAIQSLFENHRLNYGKFSQIQSSSLNQLLRF